MTNSNRTSRFFCTHLISVAMTAALLVSCSADEGGSSTIDRPNAPAPVITFTASPSMVASGGMSTLTHQVTGATGCVASGSWIGSRGASGSEAVTPPSAPGTYTYALTCTNSTGQQSTKFVTVTVTGSGSGTDPGGIVGDPNDGTTPTLIEEGGTGLVGNFVCTRSARAYGDNPTTTVSINGLVGSTLTNLVNGLGGATVTQLLNSVTAKELAVDGNLNTAAAFNQTAGGVLSGLLPIPGLDGINTIDLSVGLNSPAPAGKYAVFGLSFPTATLELSLLQSLTISTFLGADSTTPIDTLSFESGALDLLGAFTTSTGDPGGDGLSSVFAGVRVTAPYDRVSISLDPQFVAANVGVYMNVRELCTDGFFIPPAP